jgi:hypothetical protein
MVWRIVDASVIFGNDNGRRNHDRWNDTNKWWDVWATGRLDASKKRSKKRDVWATGRLDASRRWNIRTPFRRDWFHEYECAAVARERSPAGKKCTLQR